MKIGAADREAYGRDGFLILDKILAPERIASFRLAMSETFEGRFEAGLAPDKVNWRPGHDPSVPRQICNGWKANRRFASVVLSTELDRLAAVTARFLGSVPISC